MPELEKIEELSNNIKKYINTNIELAKLEVIERVSFIGSSLVSCVVIGLLFLFFLLFISFSAGFYLSTFTGNLYSGFLIVSGFYFVLGFILLFIHKKLITIPIRELIIQKLANKDLTL